MDKSVYKSIIREKGDFFLWKTFLNTISQIGLPYGVLCILYKTFWSGDQTFQEFLPSSAKKKEPSGSFLFIILDPFRENVLLEDSSDRKNRTIACI